MNEKIYIQDLVTLFAEKQDIPKKEAELFLKAFFELIEKGLDKDKLVKIKGFGSFKLVRVDSRESVDVNTGKRCIIEGHTKLSFIPDSIVKDFVNKPFSHFETVILNENVSFNELNDKVDLEVSEKEKDVTLKENIPDTALNEKINSGIQSEIIVDIDNNKEEIEENVELDTSAFPVQETFPTEETLSGEEGFTIENNQEELIEDNNEIVDLPENKIQEVSKEYREVNSDSENLFIQEIGSEDIDERLDKKVFDLSQPSYNNQKLVSQGKKYFRLYSYLIVAATTFFLVFSIIYYIFNPYIFQTVKNNVSSFFTFSNNSELPENPDAVSESLTEVELEQNEEILIEEELDLKTEESYEEEHAVIHNESIDEGGIIQNHNDPQKLLMDTTITIITGVRQGYANVKADSTSYRIVGTMERYTIKSGETLTKVSSRFYGTKDLWPYLVMHNRKIIKNPDNVPSGTTIRIPALRDKE